MTIAIEIGPANLCVSLRKRNMGHVEWIEACASMTEGVPGVFRCMGASLVLFDFRAARRTSSVAAADLVALHGFPELAAELVNDRFDRFEPLKLGRLLVLKSLHDGGSKGTNLDLALVQRVVDLTLADAIMVPWPPPTAAPQHWAQFFACTALSVERDEPAWLYQLAHERWPVELLQRDELLELVRQIENPSLQRTG